MDGLLIIDKEPGLTSHDVVAKARKILNERRIGHTGTLDPFATGVLVILLGRATRLAQFLSGTDKEYEAVIRFGFSTDTGDYAGNRLNDNENRQPGRWSESEIEEAMRRLTGDILQVPPMFSAKKVQGKRLYELARRGEVVERKAVNVCIHEFEPIRPDNQLLKNNLDGTVDLKVRVVCSSGTYIRTLAEDLGKRLNIGAHLAELRRTRVGSFSLDNAATLADLKTRLAEGGLGTILVPLNLALPELPFLHLTPDDARKVRNGMEVGAATTNWTDGAKVKLCDESGHLIAIGDYNASKQQVHPRVVITQEN